MRGPLIRPLLWLNLSWLNGKKLSNGPFLPVNDLAASAIRGQSHKELDTVVFLLTKDVQI